MQMTQQSPELFKYCSLRFCYDFLIISWDFALDPTGPQGSRVKVLEVGSQNVEMTGGVGGGGLRQLLSKSWPFASPCFRKQNLLSRKANKLVCSSNCYRHLVSNANYHSLVSAFCM